MTTIYPDSSFTPVVTAEHNDAHIYGGVSDAILDMPISVAFGEGRTEREWRPWSGNVEDLIITLSTFQRGPKDGACFTQGPLVGEQRVAKNARAAYVLMLDCDTGENLDAIHKRIADKGLFAIMWTTHSHMKDTSTIAEARLQKFARDVRTSLAPDNLVALSKSYLRDTAKLADGIADSITRVERRHAEGGIQYVVHHAPMPRSRVLLVLSEPYVFASAAATQNEAITRWKQLYAGVAVSILSVGWDQSCVDPSRLMYTPRIPPGAVIGPGQHEIRIIAGSALNLNDVAPIRTDARRVGTAVTGGAANAFTDAAPETVSYATKNIRRFMGAHKNDFEIVSWLESVGAEFLSLGVDKAELECPNVDGHTEQRADDRAFMVSNASGGLHGFHAGCLHSTCKGESGGDRAWYLDKLCAKYGVEDAMELAPYCSGTEADNTELQSITDAMRATDERAPPALINAAIDIIAAIPDRTERTTRMRELVESSHWPMSDLRPILRDRQDAQVNEVQTGAAAEPSLDALDDVDVIWAHWGTSAKRLATKHQIIKRNASDPTVFKHAEGTYVYLTETPDGLRGRAFDPTSRSRWDWLTTRLEVHFKRVDDTGIERDEEGTPASLLSYLAGDPHYPFPPLQRVVRTPIFGADGSRLVDRGYHKNTGVYFDPPEGVEFFSVAEIPTEDDVENAKAYLFDIIRDFPFSDVFDGSDPAPIRGEDVDEDGDPLPNLDRGRGSRANAIAMFLQPFIRDMIQGPCPSYHIDKPERGTGAGYLVDTAWSIFEGGPRAHVQTLSHTNEETKKSLTAFLRSGVSTLFLDNIQHKVENADLAAALTAGTWTDRVLGSSDTVTIPIRCTWIMAGNRVAFSEDMMRRNIPIFLDAATNNPSMDRTEAYYKHNPLHEVLLERRLEHVWACHTLVQNWIAKGRPRGPVALQSFTEWAHVLGGILHAAGIEGFLSNRAAYLENRNEDQDTASNVARRVWLKYRDKEVTIAEVFDALQPTGLGGFGKQEESIDPSLGLLLNGRDKAGLLRSLGTVLSREYVGKTLILDPATGLTGSWKKRRKEDGARYQLVPGTCKKTK